MAQKYWIGGFHIDLSRNQISQNNQSQTLAPKALAVLTYLAKHQGEVVSQDTLLSEVWPDTVVSPNTLQRSIAQLRKALGDDGKVQVYIKTHAKQGYSLECDVRWINHNEISQPDEKLVEETEADKNFVAKEVTVGQNSAEKKAYQSSGAIKDKPEEKKSNLVLMVTAALTAIVVGLVGFLNMQSNEPTTINISHIRALTATDNKEHGGIYSPDGQYIVFRRYSIETCSNNIWAKDAKTQGEFQLTRNLGTFGSHSFSPDGKQLAFIKSDDCTTPVNQKRCYKLMGLDFHAALRTSQQPNVLLECTDSSIRSPIWLDNNNIAMLQNKNGRWLLIRYSISENRSQVIYEVNDGSIAAYDYSPAFGKIALTSTRKDGESFIEMLDVSGKLISSHKINYPQHISRFKLIRPNFSTIDNLLIFSTGRQLYTLSYDGQVEKVSLPLDVPISSPKFHPDGDKMLAIKGFMDRDIVSVSISQLRQNNRAPSLEEGPDYNHPTIDRSILNEDKAIWQPDGDLIAFRSERFGEDQIWVNDGSGSRQLSRFPMDVFLYQFDWALDGKSILANTDRELTQVFLDGSDKTIPTSQPVETLFQWDSEKQKALALVRISGILRFVELDLERGSSRVITDKRVYWAQRSESGQLVYMDQLHRFWRPGPVEDKLIPSLVNQGSERQFVIEDNVIYGINEDHQLWSYSLEEDEFEVIGNVSNGIDYVTDVKQDDVLMSLRIASKKEVAELTLAR